MKATERHISLADADYAAIVKRYEEAGDIQNADIIRRQWDVARGGGDARPRPAETRMDAGSAASGSQVHARREDPRIAVRTWRERIGVGLDFPLHAPTDVERAMVGEIAELRALIQAQDAPKSAGASADADTRQLLVIGGQRIGKQHLLDLQRDAARYRWLRNKADGMACTAAPMVASLDAAGRVVGLIDGDELDAAVDMAAACRATKTKRVGTNR